MRQLVGKNGVVLYLVCVYFIEFDNVTDAAHVQMLQTNTHCRTGLDIKAKWISMSTHHLVI